jgi:hypothetical protein
MRRRIVYALIALVVFISVAPLGAIPYRPGLPSNFGADTRGGAGTGADICRVVNLNNSGNGSLRAALEATDDCAPVGCANDTNCRRIVIFETSGTITLSSSITINDPYITIAGQTAPDPGIQVRDYGIISTTHDVVFQHFRIRVGDVGSGNDEDAIGLDDGGMVLIDHMTLGWQPDEAVGVFQNGDGNITVWKSILHEGTECGTRDSGASPCSALGALVGSSNTNIAFIQNLFAHMNHRTPAAYGGSRGYIANNVIYNFRSDQNVATGFFDFVSSGCETAQGSEWDIVSNYYRGGPNSDTTTYALGQRYLDAGVDKLFVFGNTRDAAPGDSITEYLQLGSGADCVYEDARVGATTGHVPTAYTPLTAAASYTTVLATVGARPANRDDHEDRIITEVTNRTGTIIDSQTDVGGWETYAANTIDHDAGAHPLPASPNDDDDSDGYTNIEEWLESYACTVEGGTNCFATTWSLWSVGVGASNSADTAATTIATSTTLDITAGQLIIACTFNTSALPASVADGGGNTMTPLQAIIVGSLTVQMHYHIAPATATRTYTATYGAPTAATVRRIYVLPFSSTGEAPVLETGTAIGQSELGSTNISTGTMSPTGTQTLMAIACARTNGGATQGSPHEVNEVTAQFTDNVGGMYVWTSVNLSSFTGDLDTDIAANNYVAAGAAFESAPEIGGGDGATAVSMPPRAVGRFRGRTR